MRIRDARSTSPSSGLQLVSTTRTVCLLSLLLGGLHGFTTTTHTTNSPLHNHHHSLSVRIRTLSSSSSSPSSSSSRTVRKFSTVTVPQGEDVIIRPDLGGGILEHYSFNSEQTLPLLLLQDEEEEDDDDDEDDNEKNAILKARLALMKDFESSSSSGDSNKSNILSSPQEEEETTFQTVITKNQKATKLGGVILFVSMMFSRFGVSRSSTPTESVSVATTSTAFNNINNSFLQSVVSATMLRTNKPFATLPSTSWSWKKGIGGVLLVWQLTTSLKHSIPFLTDIMTTFSTWYMTHLTTYPLITKCITASFIGLIGDRFAQWFEAQIHHRKLRQQQQQQQQNQSTSSTSRSRSSTYDVRRGVSTMIDALFLTGPLLHFAYNALEQLLPVASATTGWIANVSALGQVIIDNFIIDSLFVTIMFITTGIAEGYSVKDISHQLQQDLVPTIQTTWMTSIVLVPIGFLIFRYLPLQFRVLGMNIIDIFWGAMVSYMAHRNRHPNNRMTTSSDTTTMMMAMEEEEEALNSSNTNNNNIMPPPQLVMA